MHWSQLFRNRPGLLLAGNGGMTRTVGKAALVSSQFSDGERMVAQLLLRLLVLKATTRLPFMWIDEPLEHLDPDTRRALSLLLATAPFSDSAGLRQVVMTTYEEPLVRRLRAAIPNTHVRYVLGAA
jgi:DNA repair exonuclease SbcCD ATPase subunit